MSDPMPERVELVTLEDPLEASMLHDLLQAEGIAVAAHGKRLARLDVPVADLERAKAIMAREGFEPGEAVPGPPPEPPRQKRIAAFCALGLTFGCGHFYARSYRVGTALALLQVACLGLVMADAVVAIVGLPFIVIADLFGALVAVDRRNGRARTDAWAKVTVALPVVAVLAVGGVPALYVVAPDALVSDSAARVCDTQARCVDRASASCRQRFAREVVTLSTDRVALDACAECLEDSGPVCRDLCACVPVCYRIAYIADCRERPSPDRPFGVFER